MNLPTPPSDRDLWVSAAENFSLYRCPHCYHLAMSGWTCPECGQDDSACRHESCPEPPTKRGFCEDHFPRQRDSA